MGKTNINPKKQDDAHAYDKLSQSYYIPNFPHKGLIVENTGKKKNHSSQKMWTLTLTKFIILLTTICSLISN